MVARFVERRLELVRHVRQFSLDPPPDVKAQARLRTGPCVGDLPAIAPGRELTAELRRTIRADIDGTGVNRLAADVRFVAPRSVDRIPAVFPGFAQQLEAQTFRHDRGAVRVEGNDLERRLGTLRDRIGAGRRSQPDGQRTLSDRANQCFGHRAAAGLEDPDPDRCR